MGKKVADVKWYKMFEQKRKKEKNKNQKKIPNVKIKFARESEIVGYYFICLSLFKLKEGKK